MKKTLLFTLALITTSISLLCQPDYCNLNYESCYGISLNDSNQNPCWKILNFEEKVCGICFVNKDVGYIMSGYKLFKTIDGGESFTLIFNFGEFGYASYQQEQNIKFINENIGYVLLFRNDNSYYYHLLLKTIDGGKNWVLKYNFNTLLGMGFDVFSENDAIIVCEPGFETGVKTIITTSDGFNTVSQYNTFNTGDYSQVKKVMMKDSKNAIFMTKNGLYRTIDGGQNWEKIHYSGILDIDYHNGFYYAAKYDGIGKSIDGKNWNFHFTNYSNLGNNTSFVRDGLGIISSNKFWVGNNYTTDFGCTHSGYEPRLSIIENIEDYSLYGVYNYAPYEEVLVKYICSEEDNIFDEPHFANIIDSIPLNVELELSNTNLRSTIGNFGYNVPVPQCWLNDASIGRPFYYYFKGNGSRIRFILNSSKDKTQFGIFSGKINCLKPVTCDEFNQWSSTIDVEIISVLDEDYYILIDNSYVIQFWLKIFSSDLTNLNKNEDDEITLFPNPTDGLLSLSPSLGIKEVLIFDIEGRYIKSIKNNFSKINLSDLPNGYYLTKIIKGNNSHYCKFVILKN